MLDILQYFQILKYLVLNAQEKVVHNLISPKFLALTYFLRRIP